MGSSTTRFKKTEVARIVEGVTLAGVKGTFEFQLDQGIVRFHMGCEPGSESTIPATKPTVWDEVLNHGQGKPALTVCKKVP